MSVQHRQDYYCSLEQEKKSQKGSTLYQRIKLYVLRCDGDIFTSKRSSRFCQPLHRQPHGIKGVSLFQRFGEGMRGTEEPRAHNALTRLESPAGFFSWSSSHVLGSFSKEVMLTPGEASPRPAHQN